MRKLIQLKNRTTKFLSADYTSNLINLIIAILTLGTLIYAVVQGVENGNDVETLAKELREQNRLQLLVMKKDVRPEFQNGVNVLITDSNTVLVTLKNNGERASIQEISVMGTQLTVGPHKATKYVRPQETYSFELIPRKGILVDTLFWTVTVRYEDNYRNPYVLLVDATGNKTSMIGIMDNFPPMPPYPPGYDGRNPANKTK